MKSYVSSGLFLVLFALMMGCTTPDAVSPDQTASARSDANAKKGATTLPFTGTLANASTVTGTLTITKFVVRNGQLFAQVSSVIVNGVQTTGSFLLPVDLLNSSGSCQILHLELGPLNLDLLGLEVNLNRIVLDITAQSGPGNLLGNLLCAIAGLLDGSNLNLLGQLLNQLLGLLG